VYRRLEAANDWGSPLSFGASLGSLLYARDEGAYYRTRGAEFGGTHPSLGALEWRVFAEQQTTANVNSRWTLFGGGNDSRFIANPPANKATEFGGSIRLRNSYGLDPEGFRASTDVRAEAAGGDFGYGRALADFTVSHPLSSTLAGSFSASVGSSVGKVPTQRQFYLGGTQTIRGQSALTGVGDAFWMARAEIGAHSVVFRPIVFADLGWAGDRNNWKINDRPMSGAGVGASFLDGLFRVDLARGMYPAKQWRLDLYLESKF
jgi:hemolysin activation/secretion protein